MTNTPAITFTINATDAVLGGGEWSPVLRLVLDEDGNARLIATERHSSENAVPMDVWHRRTLRWTNNIGQGSRVIANIDAIQALCEQLRPLLERVRAGHTVEWDGSNHVGRLTDDAIDASDEIDAVIEAAQWTSSTTVWDAAEWLSASWSDVAVTADSTDDEIEALAREIEINATVDDVILIDTVEALTARRSDLRDQRDEDAA